MFKFWRRKHDEASAIESPVSDAESSDKGDKKTFLGGLFSKREESAKATLAAPPEVPEITQTEDENSEAPNASSSVTPIEQDRVLEAKSHQVAETPTSSFHLSSDNSELVEVELPKRKLSGVRSLFGKSMDLDSLEEILLRADFGLETAEEITQELKTLSIKNGTSSDAGLRLLMKDLLTEKLRRSDSALNLSDANLPYVLLVVGVNGAGKTTTIGKLAKWLRDGQWQVVLGAADTFRAAAVEQLGTWAERSGSELVRPEKEGQDPAAVAYQTVEKAISSGADIAIIDTAGRLQNKKDLMDELAKIRRAVEKQAQVNEVLLVIDATTGQNGLSQARAFTEVANVTGIVMTKLDGSAKGGILYSLQRELDIPIKLVGVGEGVNDFAFFDPEEFALGLVAPSA